MYLVGRLHHGAEITQIQADADVMARRFAAPGRQSRELLFRFTTVMLISVLVLDVA